MGNYEQSQRVSDARLGVSLPGLPAPDRKCIRASGAVRARARSHQRTVARVRRISDEGESRTFNFCPECGATVYWLLGSEPGVVAVPVGAFADPAFPGPVRSVYEARKHEWVTLPAGVEPHA